MGLTKMTLKSNHTNYNYFAEKLQWQSHRKYLLRQKYYKCYKNPALFRSACLLGEFGWRRFGEKYEKNENEEREK